MYSDSSRCDHLIYHGAFQHLPGYSRYTPSPPSLFPLTCSRGYRRTPTAPPFARSLRCLYSLAPLPPFLLLFLPFFFPQRKVHYYCVCMMMTFFILLNCSYKIFSSYNPKRAFLHQLQYNPRAHSFLPLISSHARLAKDSLTTDPRARSTIFDTQLFALYFASQDIKFHGHCAQCLIPFPLSHTTDLSLAYPFPTHRRLLTIDQASVCH